jgi:hypothetical protein
MFRGNQTLEDNHGYEEGLAVGGYTRDYRSMSYLNNGQTVWDLAGNVWDLVDWNVDNNHTAYVSGDGAPGFQSEWNTVDVDYSASDMMTPLRTEPSNGTYTHNGNEWIGMYMSSASPTNKAILRGGVFSEFESGLFALGMIADADSANVGTGFRCVYHPNAVPPKVLSVSAVEADGTYYPGDTIDITVLFDKSVTVTGNPHILLDTGVINANSYAQYVAGSPGTTLTFRYTIDTLHSTADLAVRTFLPIDLQGGNIVDTANPVTVEANLVFPAPGTSNSLQDNKDLEIRGLPTFDGRVMAITQLRDGSGDIYVGGEFDNVNGLSYPGIVRLNSDLTIDTAFDPTFATNTGFNSWIHDIVSAPDGSGDIYVTGDFTDYNGTAANRIIRLDNTGQIVGSFNYGAGFNDQARYVIPVNDGTNDIIVTGHYTTYDTVNTAEKIIRLTDTGSVVASFSTNVGARFTGASWINRFCLNLNTHDQIYYAGNVGPRIGLLDFDGNNDDATFVPPVGGSYLTCESKMDGTSDIFAASASPNRLWAYEPDGTSAVVAGTGGGFINSIMRSPDMRDHYYLSGTFDTYGATARDRVVRIDSTYAINEDAIFSVATGADEMVWDQEYLMDGTGRILYGGEFLNFNNQGMSYLAFMNTLPVGETQPVPINITALNADNSYGLAAVINIQVQFSEAVTVTGTPQLTLNLDGTYVPVNMSSQPAADTLHFDYTVGAGHTSADLNYIHEYALSLNGGTIVGVADGHPAVIKLPDPLNPTSLGGNKDIVIATDVVQNIVKVNFSDTPVATWNTFDKAPGLYTQVSSDLLLNDAGKLTSIEFLVDPQPGTYSIAGTAGYGAQTGDDSGFGGDVPDAVLLKTIWIGDGTGSYSNTTEMRYKVRGLDPNKKYNFKFVCSRAGAGTRNVQFAIGTNTDSDNCYGNTANFIELTDITTPDITAAGEVTIIQTAQTDFGYLNGLIIEEKVPNGYVDIHKPEIRLNGDNPMVLSFGEVYVEPGATVGDDVDTPITPTIDASTVNPMMVGTYTVTYDAVDAQGNNADQVTRTVVVQPTAMQTAQINFTTAGTTEAGWNNLTADPTSGTVNYATINNTETVATGWNIDAVNDVSYNWENQNATKGENSAGAFPANVTTSAWVTDKPEDNGQILFKGLDPTKFYNFNILCSVRTAGLHPTNSGAYHTEGFVAVEGGAYDSVACESNTNNLITLNHIQPNGAGEIKLVTKASAWDMPAAGFHHTMINGMEISEVSMDYPLPEFNGTITRVYQTQNGSGDFYVVGSFSQVNGQAYSRIVRLNNDLSIDTGFDPGTGFSGSLGGSSYVFNVQEVLDGTNDIYVVGNYTGYNGTGANGIVRLTETGAINPVFDYGTGFDNFVRHSYITHDGSGDIIVMGKFNAYKGTTTHKIARITNTGDEVVSFRNNIGTTLGTTTEWRNGMCRAYGTTDTFYSTSQGGPLRMARFFEDGTRDTAFAPVGGVGIACDTFIEGSGDVFYSRSNAFLRYNDDGTADGASTFPAITSFAEQITISPDGRDHVYWAGLFPQYDGNGTGYIVRTNIAGTETNDAIFAPTTGANAYVWTAEYARDGSGRVFFAGEQTTFNGAASNRFDVMYTLPVNETQPYPINITSLMADSNYSVGQTVDVDIQFSENISITGTPQIILDLDGTYYNVNCTSVVGGDTLRCPYTVQPGHTSDDLTYKHEYALQLNGGTINGTAHNNPAVLELFDTIHPNSLKGNKAITIGGSLAVNGTVNDICPSVKYPGEFYIVGEFTTVNSLSRIGIARINSNGTVDTDFNPGTGFTGTMGGQPPVNSCAEKLDGSGDVYVVGGFTDYNSTGSQNGAILLNDDATVDTSFNLGTGFNNWAKDLVLAQDGSGDVYIGGNFTQRNSVALTSEKFARFNADGTEDTAFDISGAIGTDWVNSPELVRDGSGDVIVTTSSAVNPVIRFNPDGTQDATWMGNLEVANNWMDDVIIDPRNPGVVYLTGNGSVTNYTRLWRVNADGTTDATFDNTGTELNGFGIEGIPNPVGDDDIFVVGNFSTVRGNGRGRFVQLNSDGTLEAAPFVPTAAADNMVTAIYYANDGSGKLYLGGDYTSFDGDVTRQYLTFERAITTGTQPYITSIDSVAGDANYTTNQNIAIEVNFSENISLTGTAKLNLLIDSGIVQANCASVTGSALNCVYQVQLGDKTADLRTLSEYALVLDGGASITGTAAPNNPANLQTPIPTTPNSLQTLRDIQIYESDFNYAINTVWMIPTGDANVGKLYVGGHFTTFKGATQNRLIRLNNDLTKDATFDIGTGFNNRVVDVLELPDGSGDLIVSGEFTQYNGTNCGRIAKLDNAGNVDTTFCTNVGTGADKEIYAINFATDGTGEIYVSGAFEDWNGTPAGMVALES